MSPGDFVEIYTQKALTTAGEAIGHVPDGRVAFILGAAPEEQVRARIVRVAKRFVRAQVVEVLKPGPSRVELACAHALDCGGCPLMHIKPSEAREAKFSAGLEAIRRIGAITVPDEAATSVQFVQDEGLRTRTRLGVAKGQVGYRRSATNELVTIGACRALHPRLEEARIALTAVLKNFKEGNKEVDDISLVTNGHQVLAALPPSFRSAIEPLRTQGIDAGIRSPELLEIADRGGKQYLHPDVFSQSSFLGNEALLAEVEHLLPDRIAFALELYAGSGNFTRLIARCSKKVRAVEVSAKAVKLAQKLRLPNVDWKVSIAEMGLSADLQLDLLFVNPPRSGLEKNVRQRISVNVPQTMIYVSCDVGTLARDLGHLTRSGMIVESLRAVDLYPRTSHLEWICRLSKAKT